MSLLNYFIVFIITFLPIFELRLAIPLGVLVLGTNIFLTALVSIIANILIGIIIYFLIDLIISFFLRYKFLKKMYDKLIIRSQKKVEKYITKYGVIGLAIFIGIPLPVSGVYTGALGAKILGIKFKKFIPACIMGVIISAILVSLITMFAQNLIIGFESGKHLFFKLFL